ncbi:putative U box domain, tetratricopeptide-like helical domain superfamily [Helianthus annuus]|nr:putative U box domain, tetratricopeptide-like helical domain superfamily [Helianthus annuus]KAJ0556240.1 putative U box domain, tetratricopeptide-like helical domain superfamily [Helianthus annuus]KAJ0728067.1 putative U box domain, tetratricopeptide-like helical domain superfamily [Helianthus annuus]KAJ0730842.1 putative U box domain, tetratricopeptide-like helical domain superfamily [Helianthus annuus]KAJ0770514.1 putative U box domain, tetratricopeptide-like helical domain superfamily [He
MTKGVQSGTIQAEQLKQDGNLYFKKNRLGAAIDAYTEAITLSPNVSVYWTNRAVCYRKRNDWTRVEEDSRKAVELDHASIKGHFMLGLALIQREKYAQGIKELERALDLSRGAGPQNYMVEEIWQELAKAKYSEWERNSTKRSCDLQNLKECCETALIEKHFRDAAEVEGFVDEVTDFASEKLEALNLVFSKAAEFDTPTEIPDYLCCRITLDIFRDPVTAPSGFTYEKAVILEHLEQVGKFDPITRQPLFPSQLVQNLAIKEAVQAFLDKHGWAYKMD